MKESSATQNSTGRPISSGQVMRAFATRAPIAPGKATRSITSERTACMTSPGLASRGQRVEQSLHWWHSQTEGSAASASPRPHCACNIWRRGNGASAGASSHTAEQVAHW